MCFVSCFLFLFVLCCFGLLRAVHLYFELIISSECCVRSFHLIYGVITLLFSFCRLLEFFKMCRFLLLFHVVQVVLGCSGLFWVVQVEKGRAGCFLHRTQ